MTTPFRTALFVCTSLGALAWLAVGATRGEARASTGAEPGWSAMVHEVLVFEEGEEDDAYGVAVERAAHLREAHPATRLGAYKEWDAPRREVHLFQETVNTLAFFVANEELAECETCEQLWATMDGLLTRERHTRSRLIASAPDKERRMGPQAAVIVRSMRAHYPRVGAAVDAARRFVEHVNATYPEVYVRAYDEWHPRSGRIRFHIHTNWVPDWESVEARLRNDSVARQILEDSADAFVLDSFQDSWLVALSP